MLTNRQLKLVYFIVDIYVKTGSPVSSGQVLEHTKDRIDISSATIRNEMALLEKEGYIYKLDKTSSRTSGRIPTNKSYRYYLENIKTNLKSIEEIKSRIDSVLQKRKNNIELIIQESLEIINDATNTLSISFNKKDLNNLVDLKLYKIDDKNATIIIVSSNGDVINKRISLGDIEFKDLEIMIEFFSKRLMNTPINDLEKNSISLKEVISLEVHGVEDKFQEIVKLIFSKIIETNFKYSGMNSLISMDNLKIEKQIKNIFKMIETNSIWKLLNLSKSIEENLKIKRKDTSIDIETIDGVSIISKGISYGEVNKSLTIFGSKNQDYEQLFSMLDYLEEKIKGD